MPFTSSCAPTRKERSQSQLDTEGPTCSNKVPVEPGRICEHLGSLDSGASRHAFGVSELLPHHELASQLTREQRRHERIEQSATEPRDTYGEPGVERGAPRPQPRWCERHHRTSHAELGDLQRRPAAHRVTGDMRTIVSEFSK